MRQVNFLVAIVFAALCGLWVSRGNYGLAAFDGCLVVLYCAFAVYRD